MRNQIIEFYNDPDFQRLNSYYNRTTIFNILNIERSELSHSAFLKWLFDINGSHNFGKEPLKKLLRMLVNTDNDNILSEDILNILLIGDYEIHNFHIETEKVVESDKNKGRIDIFAKFGIFKKDFKKDVVVIIENKVDSKHHDDQTKTYKVWADKEYDESVKIPIYLTPYPESEKDEITNYFIITYQDILEHVIEPLLNMEIDSDTKIILEDYIINLGQAKKQIDDKGKESDLETILAVSKKNKEIFSNLLDKYEKLLDASLVAKYSNNDLLKNIFEDELNDIKKIIEDDNCESLLKSFWESNNQLLRMIFLYGDESDENLKELLKTSASKTIQNFYFKDKEYKGRGRLCHAIVKDYIENHRDITIEELRNTFDTNAMYKKKHVYFVDSIENAEKVLNSQNIAGGNYYTKEDEQIPTNEGNVVVWDYWPDRFYRNFENKIRSLGYNFE